MSKANDKHAVFIWTPWIGDFLRERGSVGGITVQLYFWCVVLHRIGFTPWTLTSNRADCEETGGRGGIHFLYLSEMRWLAPVFEVFAIFRVLFCLCPEAVFLRGATRSLFLFALLGRITRSKIVFFLANDDDPVPGKELICRTWDRILYRAGLRLCRCFVCQNSVQKERLAANYGKHDALLIPNLWVKTGDENSEDGARTEILWVSNLRRLKRPEWFLELAKRFPGEHFTMAGGPYEAECFAETKRAAESLANVSFLGRRSFSEVEALFRTAKLLVCTSETEGFPNTFLQAWSRGIPVLSTVDPSGVIASNGLGAAASDLDALAVDLGGILAAPALYHTLCSNTEAYFRRHYNAVSTARCLCGAFGITIPDDPGRTEGRPS